MFTYLYKDYLGEDINKLAKVFAAMLLKNTYSAAEI
jgi:hypothetical protein